MNDGPEQRDLPEGDEPSPDQRAPTPHRVDAFPAHPNGQGALANQAARSGVIMFGAHGLQFFLGVGAMMLLARLLGPEEFGLLAMAGVVVGFASIIKDFGLTNATVQKDTLDQDELSMLFWLNLKLGAVLAALLALSAPLVAWFFQRPVLMPITLVLSAAVFVSAASNIHMGLLKRQMRFGIVSLIEVVTLVLALGAAIAIAATTGSVWALVAEEFIFLAAGGLGTLIASGWRPSRIKHKPADDAGYHAMRLFGKNLTLTKVVGYLSETFGGILVGKMLGASEIGLYNNAQRWSVTVPRQLHIPLLGVIIATLSRLQNEPERYRKFFRAIVSSVYLLSFPALAFLYIDAREFILVLLGDKWEQAIPLFRIMLIGACGYTGTRVIKWVYLSEGRTKDYLRLSLFIAPVSIGAVAVGAAWGLTGIAWGYTAGMLATALPAYYVCTRRSPLRLMDLVGPAVFPILAATATAGLIHLSRGFFLTEASFLIRFLVHGVLFLTLYTLASLAYPPGVANMLQLIRLLRSGKT